MNAPASNVIQYEPPHGEAIPQTPMAMLQLAVAKNMTPETIKGFMDLQERWEKSEAVKAYNHALAAFKAEAVEIIKKKRVHFTNKSGGVTDYKHAELSDVIEAIGPALSRHGFAWGWKTKQEKTWIEVTCELRHALGHMETVTLGAPPDDTGGKNNVQQIVSTVSYLERHTLKAACGVAEKGEDSDGRQQQKGQAEPDPAGKAALEKCGSLKALQEAWAALTPAQRKTLAAVKEDCKQQIEAADKEAAK